MHLCHPSSGLLLLMALMVCIGVAEAAPTVPADVAVVAKYPNEEIARLAGRLQEADLLDFEREEVRRLICTTLVVKPARDAVTLEKFLVAWQQVVPGVSEYKMVSELKLADLLLKNADEATEETERESKKRLAVSWLEKILAVDSEAVGLQAVTGDRLARVHAPGAREKFHPLPLEMVEERAQRQLARISDDAKADASKLRRAAAHRLAHLAALVAEKSGDFSRCDELVKSYGADPDVGEIFRYKRLRSRILGGSRKASFPVPKVTPYDGDASKRVTYLEGYNFGYRSILASVKADSLPKTDGPLREAAREGWAAGEAQARSDHPEKAAEMPDSQTPLHK